MQWVFYRHHHNFGPRVVFYRLATVIHKMSLCTFTSPFSLFSEYLDGVDLGLRSRGPLLRISSINSMATLRARGSSALPSDVGPLGLVSLVIHGSGGQLWSLLVLNLLRNDEVENDGHEGRNGKASLHDELDSVEETRKSAVVASIGKDMVEPTEDLLVPDRNAQHHLTYVGTRVAP